jgi:hypothetical protein
MAGRILDAEPGQFVGKAKKSERIAAAFSLREASYRDPVKDDSQVDLFLGVPTLTPVPLRRAAQYVPQGLSKFSR